MFAKVPVQQFLVYLVIQGVAMGVDFGTLALELRLRVPVPIGVIVALGLALGLHFFLNRNFNFRNFDRPLHQQLRTYIVLAVTVSAFTVAWVEVLSQWFGVPVLVAKALSMPITAVLGYATTRNLTFGKGIVATIKERFVKP